MGSIITSTKKAESKGSWSESYSKPSYFVKNTNLFSMDLRKVPDEEKVKLCRKYTIIGLAFLPFLWFVNVVWFFKEAFIRDSFPGQTKMRGDVIKSAIGLAIWIAGLVTWIVIFQRSRSEWGAFGDQISFLIPLGEP